MENKAVQVVTIKSLTTLYKEGQEANSIELANVEEHNFDVIVGKGLYNIGDKAIYIQPDYCVPLISQIKDNVTLAQLLFAEYTQPNGDTSKSKLGKNGRIKAIKFNFTKDVNVVEPIYSFGILIPYDEVLCKLKLTAIPDDLDTLLEITKYEEPETGKAGLTKGSLPLGMYSTDETNIMNLTRTEYPITLTGSLKVDGSSITVYYKNSEEKGICSRNLEKKLENNSDCSFVKLGTPALIKLEEYCKKHNLMLALRGEIHGVGLKGSGNKNNPHANLKQNVKFYGVDDYSTGVTKKMSLSFFYNLMCELELDYCDVIFDDFTFDSFDELKTKCNNYFKDNLVEGIVLRNEHCTFSAKFMNPIYDSKK